MKRIINKITGKITEIGDDVVEHHLKMAKKHILYKVAKNRKEKQDKTYSPKPRYDDIFFEGIEWLNNL